MIEIIPEWIEKLEDEEKIITRYAYLNREDEDLYRDLFED